jgi:hypothetical protein
MPKSTPIRLFAASAVLVVIQWAILDAPTKSELIDPARLNESYSGCHEL